MPGVRGRKAAALSVAAVVTAIAAVLVWPRPWVLVRHGPVLRYAFAGGDNTRFDIRWQHSVEKEDWIECYMIHDGAIEIASTRFKTFGAGVPAHAGRHTTLRNGWVEMSGIDRVVDPLAIQAAYAEHYRMRYEGGPWRALSKPGQAPILEFEVVRAPLYEVWRGAWAAWWGETVERG